MKHNVGNLESFFRIFIGVALLYSAIYGYIGQWGFLGVILIATGLGRICPLKALFGCKGDHCAKEGQH